MLLLLPVEMFVVGMFVECVSCFVRVSGDRARVWVAA